MFIENPIPLVIIQNSIYINSSATVHNFPRDCDGLNVVTNFLFFSGEIAAVLAIPQR